MIDTGDIFMVQWVPGERKEGRYLVTVIEPDPRGSGWICAMCHNGKHYFYYSIDIEEGKKLLESYTTYR